MDIKDFRERLENDEPSLDAWGKFVVDTVSSSLRKILGEDTYKDWVKIEPTYRVKSSPSFLSKAFVLNKGWFSCYEDIKDKVGARLVLGLSQQITEVANIVQECDLWIATPSREFDDWRTSNPRLFDYQSAHLHLESLEDQVLYGVNVPCGTTCELQIRTLLQHAYAELSHDTLYKSNITSQPEIHRLFAKSMALMETTDDMLARAKDASRSAVDFVTTWRKAIRNYVYNTASWNHVPFSHEDREDDFVIDSLTPLLKKTNVEDFRAFCDDPDHVFISTRIAEAQSTYLIFNSCTILLLYFFVWRTPRGLAKDPPIDRSILAKIFSDMGTAPPWAAT